MPPERPIRESLLGPLEGLTVGRAPNIQSDPDSWENP